MLISFSSQIFTGRTAAQTNELCSLFDPYIGQDAGYVQVTPLLGTLPPLTVIPVGKSPLEGWRFLPESTSAAPYYQSQTFEALYEWQFHTLAYAQNEWAGVTPWNAPTSAILQPGETRTYGIEFRLAPSIRQIEQTVRSVGRPVAAGVPGYIISADQTAKLFLNYSSPIQSISVSPSGALTWSPNSDAKSPSWIGYDITAKSWGRARLSIVYADGTLQTVHYYLIKAATAAVSDLGSFLTTAQWFNSTADPFKRSPSVISYDREVNAFVANDPRAWIPGLSDEAGAGSWLAAAMKQYAQPNAAEVAKMEQFINKTLWGSIQNSDGTLSHACLSFWYSLFSSRIGQKGGYKITSTLIAALLTTYSSPFTFTNRLLFPVTRTLRQLTGEIGGLGTKPHRSQPTAHTTTYTSLQRIGRCTVSHATTPLLSRLTLGSGTSTKPS